MAVKENYVRGELSIYAAKVIFAIVPSQHIVLYYAKSDHCCLEFWLLCERCSCGVGMTTLGEF